jgi:hypothetical protein
LGLVSWISPGLLLVLIFVLINEKDALESILPSQIGEDIFHFQNVRTREPPRHVGKSFG